MSATIFPPAGPPLVDLSIKLATLFREWGSTTFAHAGYPQLEMNALADAGLLTCTLPGGLMEGSESPTADLLEMLRHIGRGNLSVGRIFEGHLNALLLIEEYGTPEQQRRWYADAAARHVFAVWNTEMADGVTFARETDGGIHLTGAKSFCSGSTQISRPLITGNLREAGGESAGWQLAVVPLDRHDPVVDRTFWTTLGMRNSVSHKIDFTGIHLGAEQLLGAPDDYNRQPFLTAGSVRFAAVQLGGAEAILHATCAYLHGVGRTDDPHQRRRVARMTVAVESARLWLPRAGDVIDRGADASEIIYTANMVRTVVAEACRTCLQLSDECVGARGMLPPQDLARLHADLLVYLRQPAPDAALDAIGQHTLDAIS